MATQERIPGSGYGDPYVDSLVTGYVWRSPNAGPTVIRVAFAEGDIRTGGGPGEGDPWTSAERTAFYKAMSIYESYINVDFQVMGDYSKADILWYSVDDSILKDPTVADHGLPDGEQSQQFGRFRWDTPSWNYLRPGQSGFETIIHELGHGLGLDHPFPDGAPVPGFMPFPGVSSSGDLGDNEFNQDLYTIMSYNDGWDDADATLQYGQAMTPMAFDIAALQVMYGANMSYRTGNDAYHIGVDYNAPATGWTCIWDAGGNDTITAVGSNLNATIDLRAATLIQGDDGAGGRPSYYFDPATGKIINHGYTIAHGVVIENAVGGNGDDTLIGNYAHNNLTGGLGADVLNGGDGYDTAIYDNQYYGQVQVIDMKYGTEGTLDAAGDTFISIERVLGSDGEEVIRGTDGIEALYGRGGNDTLTGRGGADILDGGAGIDVVAYESTVTVDLMFSYLNTGEAAGDTFNSIEGIDGSNTNDDLRGDGLNNTLRGGFGNDLLRGRAGDDNLVGGAGNDTMWGDDGNDVLDGAISGYSFGFSPEIDTMYGGVGDDVYLVDSQDDVVVEFAGQGYDTIGVLSDPSRRSVRHYTLAENSNVEALVGEGNGTLHLTGNSQANDITGGFGDDRLYGMGGNDTLNGWVGNDTLDGGDGDDTFMAGNRAGNDTYIGGDGIDTLAFYHEFGSGITFDLATGYWSEGFGIAGRGRVTTGSITVSEIENVRGSEGDDTFYGDANNNRLEGAAGNDTLDGRAGNDVLDGGLGFDSMSGGDGDDRFIGRYEYSVYGVDFMDGGAGSDTADFSTHGHAIWADLEYGGREVWTRDNASLSVGTWRQVADLQSVENLTGTAGGDALYGNAAANRFEGRGGNDIIDGRDGNDVLTGGFASENDAAGFDGDDTVNGGAGDDEIIVSFGSDVLDGGDGSDTLSFAWVGADLSISLADGHTDFQEGGSYVTEFGGAGWSTHVDVTWSNFENLTGGLGNDRLAGNGGNNRLAGGGGTDTFVLADGWGQDTITDFAEGEVLDFRLIGGLWSVDQLVIYQDVAGAVIQFGGDSILLAGFNATNLTAEDFLFAEPPPNAAPTDIVVDGGSVVENAEAGVRVATLRAIDADADDTFTFTLADPSGLFEIVGNESSSPRARSSTTRRRPSMWWR